MFGEIEGVEILMPGEMNERLTKDNVVVVVRVRIARAFQGPLLNGGYQCQQEISGEQKPATLQERRYIPGQCRYIL
jgi:hypothetical protein